MLTLNVRISAGLDCFDMDDHYGDAGRSNPTFHLWLKF
jgi:hypothetical protein